MGGRGIEEYKEKKFTYRLSKTFPAIAHVVYSRSMYYDSTWICVPWVARRDNHSQLKYIEIYKKIEWMNEWMNE